MSLNRPPRATTDRALIGLPLTSSALALAVAAVACAYQLRGAPALACLVVLLGAVPLGVVLGSGGRAGIWAAAALPVGALTMAGGVVLSRRDSPLDLFRFDFPITQVVTGAAVSLAPIGLVAAGLVLMLAGAAVRAGARVARLFAAGLAVLLAGVVALGLLAYAFQPLSYQGGVVQEMPIVAAAVLAVASGLLLVLTVRLDTVAAIAATAGTAPSRGGRRVVSGLVAVTLVGIVAVVAWPQRQVSDRLEPQAVFADPALAACVAAGVGAGSGSGGGERISERDLDGLTALNCDGQATTSAGPISSLVGIGQLSNLFSLDLSNNRLTDLAPLAGTPKLTSLKLSGNDLQDVGGLGALPDLSELGLSDNRITDVGQLQYLTSVRYLGLAGNDIADVGPLAGLSAVTELDLSRNRIADVRPLASLTQLDRLTLSRNRITDPSTLQRLPGLTMLDVRGNRIKDAGTVAGCPTVNELWLGENPITDVGPLTRMKALQGVDLEGLKPSTKGLKALQDKGIYVGGLA